MFFLLSLFTIHSNMDGSASCMYEFCPEISSCVASFALFLAQRFVAVGLKVSCCTASSHVCFSFCHCHANLSPPLR